ncbi:MAG: glutamate-5-semialdehyde dehydrogenase, partial [Candidatus Omnitrophica bacterium]|nr:glutamate-5-semialdehyde dehydrogenase [Candidatus Omnitrophota bacterium]
KDYLIRENKKDLKAGVAQGLSNALIDRLTLNGKRIKGMAQCLLDTVAIKDPIGEVMKTIKRPNGLLIKKVRTPIGVVGIIYESRPNVTSDCVGLGLKSGNAVILKGGKEAFYSNKAIYSILRKALRGSKVPVGAIQFVSSTDRAAVNILLQQDEYVDLIVPRGGEGLIRFVVDNTRISVVKHYKGICHTYVAKDADLNMAHAVCFNAKVQRPGVCNAMETMLVHKACAARFLPKMIGTLQEAGVEVRGCPETLRIVKRGVKAATLKDWGEEYLDKILSVKVVNNLDEAIDHINTFGSRHSDAIITRNKHEAARFFKSVDSACLYVNASTRFTDGFEFGFGAEVGISTDKLHARGPMALEGLTTYKYEIHGKGQIRQ